MKSLRDLFYSMLMLTAMSLMGVSGGAVAAISGAIYTSLPGGVSVNANIYDNKSDVYLNGGPPPNAPCTSGGLTPGEYYFQVTDPSGQTLLSTDGIEDRKFLSAGGVITQNLGTHATSGGKCPGAISIQLLPFLDTPNNGGEYKVWVTPVSAYDPNLSGTFGFVAGNVKTDNFKVKCVSNCGGETPPPEGTISGVKFYDSNTDGLLTAGEPGIFGWKIIKVPPNEYTTTDLNGIYEFINVADGTYTISESAPFPGFIPAVGAVWINTTPLSGEATVTGGNDADGPDFGNVCIGPGGGKTLGFWSNKNGQKVMSNIGGVFTTLSNMNLRKADGSNFNPTSYTQFRTWILNATATNMAYMLSAQMAAMKLNVLSGMVNGAGMIYAPELLAFAPITGLNGLGFISVNDLINAANTSLGANGLVLAGNPVRPYQEALKNALDRGNNDLGFVVAPTNPKFNELCPIVFD
jgi:hypothetical protein